jgi:hypothetical protein
VVAGNAYVISNVGTVTTLAGWQNLGLPVGLTPALSQAFIAPSTTVSTGDGQIMAPATAGAGTFAFDQIGDANQMAQATNGAYLIFRTLAATSSSVTSLVPTAPANTAVIKLRFSMYPLSSQLH